jgi:hypothetical protein
MPNTASTTPNEKEVDAIWGAAAIGREIGRTAGQIYYLHRVGALKDAVVKLGPKTYVASRRKLQALPLSKLGK